MNNVRFYLKDKKAKNKTLIMGVLYIGAKQRVKLSTGISIPPNAWNENKQLIRNGFENQYEINELLRNFQIKLEKIQIDLLSNYTSENITPEVFKAALESKDKIVQLKKQDFIDIYSEFVVRTSKRIKAVSIKTYHTTKKHLIDFEKHRKNKLSFTQLNSKFYEEYRNFCYEQLNLNPNTFGRDIKNIKAFIKDSVKLGITPVIDVSDFKSISVPVFAIALSEDDLDKLRRADLDEDPKLEKIRLMFLLECYLGMRINDLYRFGPANVKKDHVEFIQNKTGEKVYLPIHDDLRIVLNFIAPDYKLPKISEQRYNDYLKDICKIACLNESHQVPIYKGNQKTIEIHETWELVSSHTARRTFCTIGISKGIPAETLMKFSGHKSLTDFLKYVRLQPKIYMDIIRKAWTKNV